MAEIGASRQVWPDAKHQLCWWHQREALRRRLKGNLPTTPYNVQRASHEYAFIDTTFKPYGRADPNDCEGRVPGEICEQGPQGKNVKTLPLTSEDPNSIKIRIPMAHRAQPSQTPQSTQDNSSTPIPAGSHPGVTEVAGHSTTLADGNGDPLGASTNPSTIKLTLRIPAPSTVPNPSPVIEDEPDSDQDLTMARRIFCPLEHRDTIVAMIERHFCAHPLIPGYSAPTPEGIKAWAVKQIYEFCVLHDLPNLWAYLWENWYRCGRWELWARSGNPKEVPRLKTTMLVEGQ